MTNSFREGRSWVVWLTIIALISVALGIFFYYTLFRQSEMDLVEAIPTDAVFVFEINKNDDFAADAAAFSVYLNEIFVMDALPAFETMYSKLPSRNHCFTISAHEQGDGLQLLFNLRADKSEFKHLLRTFKIDPKNYTSFETYKVYTYGTNFKSMKFVYNNNVLTVSSDLELLKRSLLQQKHPKKILSDKGFRSVYELTEKNRKQNWLLINQESYTQFLKSFFNNEIGKKMGEMVGDSEWSAFQLRFSDKSIYLSGYTLLDNSMYESNKHGDGFSLASVIPFKTMYFTRYDIVDLKSLNLLSHSRLSEKDISALNSISPREMCNFAFKQDTNTVRLLAVLSDTNVSVLNFYSGTEVSDSLVKAVTDNIYPLPMNYSAALMPISNDTLRWFYYADGAFVFAPSRDDIQTYRKTMSRGESIAANPDYKLVAEAVASSSIKEYSLINDKNSQFINEYLSDKGMKSKVGQNLRAVSYSVGKPADKKFVPLNVYISF